MKKIYSYIEAKGLSLRPPRMDGPEAEAPEYLACIDDRHYIAYAGPMPPQPPEIRFKGPMNLRAEPELRRELMRQAGPLRSIRQRRAEDYPDIGEQLDALLKEFDKRRQSGEKLTAELDDMLDRCLAVKERHPKPDLGL